MTKVPVKLSPTFIYKSGHRLSLDTIKARSSTNSVAATSIEDLDKNNQTIIQEEKSEAEVVQHASPRNLVILEEETTVAPS